MEEVEGELVLLWENRPLEDPGLLARLFSGLQKMKDIGKGPWQKGNSALKTSEVRK